VVSAKARRELELRVGIRYVMKENSGVKPGREGPVGL